jgi:hypothetical protein
MRLGSLFFVAFLLLFIPVVFAANSNLSASSQIDSFLTNPNNLKVISVFKTISQLDAPLTVSLLVIMLAVLYIFFFFIYSALSFSTFNRTTNLIISFCFILICLASGIIAKTAVAWSSFSYGSSYIMQHEWLKMIAAAIILFIFYLVHSRIANFLRNRESVAKAALQGQKIKIGAKAAESLKEMSEEIIKATNPKDKK